MKRTIFFLVILNFAQLTFSQKQIEVSILGGWSIPNYRYFLDHKTIYGLGAAIVYYANENQNLGFGLRYYHTNTTNRMLDHTGNPSAKGYFNNFHAIGTYKLLKNKHIELNPTLGLGYQYIFSKFEYKDFVYKENIHGLSSLSGMQVAFPITKNFKLFTEYQFIYGKLFNNQDFSKIKFFYQTFAHTFNGGVVFVL